MDAKSLVIPGEDPAELEALAESYRQQFQPVSPVEVALLDTLVTAEWELRRLRKIQPKLWSEEAFLDPDSTEAKRLARFYRRLDTTERSYHRALKELNKYAAARAQIEYQAAKRDQAAEVDAKVEKHLASFLQYFCEPPTGAPFSFHPEDQTAPDAGEKANL
ncbi:MAG TPA: hypothetical protein VKV17_16970 [Bryobacteraceae bacterium]|nr:hypothetical protein [Bryobacteraceae bacterium]